MHNSRAVIAFHGLTALFTSAAAGLILPSPPAAASLHELGHNSQNVQTPDHMLRTAKWGARSSANELSYTLRHSDDAEPGHFWLSDPDYIHKMPFAPDDYKVFRNVKDPKYGAKGDGITDDYAAIQAAITDGDRCGTHCNGTTIKGAIIYFPPGRYAVSRPLIQYYFTTFIGNPNNMPAIKATKSFKGIALIDTNYYDPAQSGKQWWDSQNNFYRQIRNIIIDMRDMPNYVQGGVAITGQESHPVGIHWQVSQACTMQNVMFLLPQTSNARHIGIFQENGSGGFVSDLTFIGGKYCWVAGSQQYTARNIKFRGCQTAIYMLWDWGWTLKNIDIQDSNVGIDASEVSQSPDPLTKRYQGTGSLTVLDSIFYEVKEAIRVPKNSASYPTLLLDNLKSTNVGSFVKEAGGSVLRTGEPVVQWGLGWRFEKDHPDGVRAYGEISPRPVKQRNLLTADSTFFGHSKPQYEDRWKDDIMSVLRFGAKNDGNVQSAAANVNAINNAFRLSAATGKIIVFPAGIYIVDDTVTMPAGARIQGALWSQIMAVGARFADPRNPRAVLRVGQVEGEKGVIEISDMMLTTKGNTAGAVLIEWNAHEESQGSAAMWDVIARVGGAHGTDLDAQQCLWTRSLAKQDTHDICMASSMMLHVKPSASIYLENAWLWVADHDLDDGKQTRVNVYGARGALIESKGPSWIQSVSSEHSTLYQWQLSGAESIYLGQIQSETPYFQAAQTGAEFPYAPGISNYTADPTFGFCSVPNWPSQFLEEMSVQKTSGMSQPLLGSVSPASSLDTCRESWALRILNSRHVYLYGGAFYSFFNNYEDACAKTGNVCQDRVVETSNADDVWMYSLYTVGAKEVVTPQGKGFRPVLSERLYNGFATAISAWLMLADPR